MSEVSRNDAIEIARRTQRNLEHIKQEFDCKGEDSNVHVVTQLVNSLLGMVILLHEKYLEDYNKSIAWQDLVQAGWPGWEITLGATESLGDLIWHIRNGAAHGLLTYSSDSRRLEEVTITVKDRPAKCKPINWCARIRGDYLYHFCRKFAVHVENTIG